MSPLLSLMMKWAAYTLTHSVSQRLLWSSEQLKNVLLESEKQRHYVCVMVGQLSLSPCQGTHKRLCMQNYLYDFLDFMCFLRKKIFLNVLQLPTSQEIGVIKPSLHSTLARAKITPTYRPNMESPVGRDKGFGLVTILIHKNQLREFKSLRVQNLKFLGGEIKTYQNFFFPLRQGLTLQS